MPKPPKKVRFLRLKAAVALPLLIGAAIIAYWLMIDGVIADQLVAQGKAYAGKGGQAQVLEGHVAQGQDGTHGVRCPVGPRRPGRRRRDL